MADSTQNHKPQVGKHSLKYYFFFKIVIFLLYRLPCQTFLNCRILKDGSTWYLTKWRDLPYDQATWELEESDIPELSRHIEDYHNLRAIMYGEKNLKPRKSKKKKKQALKDIDADYESADSPAAPIKGPPSQPATDVCHTVNQFNLAAIKFVTLKVLNIRH